jgi:hypothetical protein
LAQEAEIQRRCREAACDLFSLEGGVIEYEAIYQKLEH